METPLTWDGLPTRPKSDVDAYGNDSHRVGSVSERETGPGRSSDGSSRWLRSRASPGGVHSGGLSASECRALWRTSGAYSKATPILFPLIQMIRQLRIIRSLSVIN
jgi:hypothetical protein